jgi:invasion protein IalB
MELGRKLVESVLSPLQSSTVKMKILWSFVAGGSILLSLCPSFAQQPKTPPVAADSQISTTSYGEWALRCRRAGDLAKDPRDCEIALTLQEKGQTAPFAKLSLGRPRPGEPLHAVILLPTNVAFPSSVRITTDEKDVWGQELDWRRCVPGGCFAEAVPSDAIVRRWRNYNAPAKLVFKNAEGADIVVPLSFDGFGQALDALNK